MSYQFALTAHKNGIAAQIAAERETLEILQSDMLRVHDTIGPDWEGVQSRLLHIRNPQGNYEVARRAAVSDYLDARKWGSKNRFQETRQRGLIYLAHAKKYYAPLLVAAGAA